MAISRNKLIDEALRRSYLVRKVSYSTRCWLIWFCDLGYGDTYLADVIRLSLQCFRGAFPSRIGRSIVNARVPQFILSSVYTAGERPRGSWSGLWPHSSPTVLEFDTKPQWPWKKSNYRRTRSALAARSDGPRRPPVCTSWPLLHGTKIEKETVPIGKNTERNSEERQKSTTRTANDTFPRQVSPPKRVKFIKILLPRWPVNCVSLFPSPKVTQVRPRHEEEIAARFRCELVSYWAGFRDLLGVNFQCKRSDWEFVCVSIDGVSLENVLDFS